MVKIVTKLLKILALSTIAAMVSVFLKDQITRKFLCEIFFPIPKIKQYNLIKIKFLIYLTK